MSRGYNARRKARRQQAQAAIESRHRQSRKDSRRLVVLLPVLLIAAVLISTAILGLSSGNNSKQQIAQEVTELLADVPQDGVTLGSPEAQVTIRMFADLECPTVRQFVESYLPSFISTWVRPGTVKIEYRSLKTDTTNEETFFRQEAAALAAGRQNKMWNFALAFVRQQEQPFTEYATDSFLTEIASQVPELDMNLWDRNREDPALSKAVALGMHSADVQGLRSTPSFTIAAPASKSSALRDLQASLNNDLQALREEASGDTPTLKVF